jgi:hypothetical protein
LPQGAERYTLTFVASDLQSKMVQLNGQPLQLGTGDTVPALAGVPATAGNATLPPASITFLVISEAGNPACR